MRRLLSKRVIHCDMTGNDRVEARQCLFCWIRRVNTTEHIVPRLVSRWIREISPPTAEHGAPLDPAAGATHVRHSKEIDHKLAAACRDCNSEFFNKIQGACEGTLKALIKDEPRAPLDSRDKRALAAWAYKTALLMSLIASPRAIWPSLVGGRCHDFYIQRRPEVGARVWAARYELPSSWPDLVNRADMSEVGVIRGNTQFSGRHVLLTLGYLLLSVVFWPIAAPDYVPFEEERYPDSRFTRLWPVDVGVTPWPPSESIPYPLLGAISEWEQSYRI